MRPVITIVVLPLLFACATRAPVPLATAPAGTAGSAPPAPAVPRADCGAAFFCDDFEAGVPGQPPAHPWKLRTVGGSVEIDAAKAFRGTKSVHLRTFEVEGRLRRAFLGIEGAPHFAQARPLVSGRMMLWLDAVPTTNAHWSNVEGDGTVPGRGFAAKSRYGGQFRKMMANYDSDRKAGFFTDCAKRAPEIDLPVQRWVCMEWRFDSGRNEMHLWLDGEPVDKLTVTGRGDVCLGHALDDNWLLPAYEAMRIGWQNFQSAPPVDMWIDDVAFGIERVGCPAAAATATAK